MQQYHLLERLLREELDVEPMQETQRLYAEIEGQRRLRTNQDSSRAIRMAYRSERAQEASGTLARCQ